MLMNKIKSRLKAFERVSHFQFIFLFQIHFFQFGFDCKLTMSSKADKNHLTLKQKAELCEMSIKPNFNKEKICKDYGIHRTTLNRILQKKDTFLNCEKETF